MPPEQNPLPAIQLAIDKFTEVLSRWAHLDYEEIRLKKRMGEIAAEKEETMKRYHDCYTMARLFGFDLDLEYKAHLDKQTQLNLPSRSAAPALPPIEAKPKTIRERVLDAARRAYPNAVRAADIRKQLEAEGIQTHVKTIGMTLFRLSKEGLVTRDGWDWYFVPELPAQEQESPGSQPGLAFDSDEKEVGSDADAYDDIA